MEAAVAQSVPGIEAQCYGSGVCGTCHVYVANEWRGATGDPSEWEAEMLRSLPLAGPRSRLACQIKLTRALDGLVVETPLRQGA